MRAPVPLALCLGAILGLIDTASGGVVYHFMPGVQGQVAGNAQFATVAPILGPATFTVQVSGALDGFAPSGSATSASAYLDKWGLGVFNPAADKDLGVQGQVQIDGKNGGEYLRLTFPAPVRLTFLTFASVGLVDQFELIADGNPVDLDALFPGAQTIKEISNSQGNWPGKVDFTMAKQPLAFATRWDVLVTGSSIGDGIQLENAGGEEVPEPGSLVLWGVGLAAAGCYWARRRNGQ